MVIGQTSQSYNMLLFLQQSFLSLSPEAWTAMSVFASMLMVVATFITLWQNRKQSQEMKKQWEEEQRARIALSIVSNRDYFYLKVENIGSNMARNIQLKFGAFFKEKMLTQSYIDYYEQIENRSFYLSPHSRKYFYFAPQYGFDRIDFCTTGETIMESDLVTWANKYQDEAITLSCCYMNMSGDKQYVESYNSYLKDLYNKAAIVIDNEVDALLEVNKTIKQIHKYYKAKSFDCRRGLC